MCNVCVAECALGVSACRKESCHAFQDGYRISWTAAPRIDLKAALRALRPPSGKNRRTSRRRTSAKGTKPLSLREQVSFYRVSERPTIFVRARGRGAETRGEFQVRREGGTWPKEWQKIDDLANAMSLYGLDVKWRFVPEAVQDWASYRSHTMPTADSLSDALEAKHEARAEREERVFARKRTKKLARRQRVQHAKTLRRTASAV